MRRRRARLRQRLSLAGLIGAMLTLLMLSPVGKTLVSWTGPAEAPSTDERTPRAVETHGPGPGPAVAETPLPNPEGRASRWAERRDSPESVAAATLPFMMRRSVTGPHVDAPATAIPALSATDPPQSRDALKDLSPQTGLPQVDVTRNSALPVGGRGRGVMLCASRTRADVLYGGADVLLRISLADGTRLDVSLGAGPNLGTYVRDDAVPQVGSGSTFGSA